MNTILKIESALLATLLAMLFVIVGGFEWWWLLALFIVFDISAIGYAINPKVGAFTYNSVHSFILPSLLFIAFLITSIQWMQFVSLLWLFHIAVDRALGYGLKYKKGFIYTHIDTIGKGKHKKV